MTIQKAKAIKIPGSNLIGMGTVVACIGLAMAFMSAGSPGSVGLVLALTIGGLLLVVIGYLKRISAALTARQ